MEGSLKYFAKGGGGSNRSSSPQMTRSITKALLGRRPVLLLGSTVAICLAVVAAGVHLGAHGEDRWFTGAVIWLSEILKSL